MTDESDEPTKAEAIEKLNNNSGQSYVLASEAWRILGVFYPDVERDFVEKYDPFGKEIDDPDEADGAHALSNALRKAQRSSAEARGITNTYPHEMLVTYSDVSAVLVEALGGEPDDTTMGGHGFTADSRHDANLETLDDLLDEPVEA